jgi:hypothetical protein
VLLALMALSTVAPKAAAQRKGELDLGLAGDIFESTKIRKAGSATSTVSSPAILLGYYVGDKIRLDGEFSILFGEAPDAAEGAANLAIPMAVGVRYAFWRHGHLRLNGGVALETILGSAGKLANTRGQLKTPFEFALVPAELQWWPMEGGAVTVTSFYEVGGLNLGNVGQNSYGIKLGLLIRLK